MGQKNCELIKNLGKKKMFGSKKIWVKINFDLWVRHFWIQEVFGQRRSLASKKISSVHKSFGARKHFGSKKSSGEKGGG